ncbi:hypothetical protein OPV22_026684 [Ensete ventricosum]|uniref:Uncharacterized protein n=1 Tax=Ensete ventricosum TaxID=4639 RepID=A0AAV8P275_ENSVE|nr:hypothetical protein OPV22_026684 [Ensete ventricosum]
MVQWWSSSSSAASLSKKPNRFGIKKWNAIALWASGGMFMFMVGVSDMVVLGSAISLQALNAQAYTSEELRILGRTVLSRLNLTSTLDSGFKVG